MKRALRFGLLMGALGFAAWVGSDKPAFAIQYCEFQNGTPCYVPRATEDCLYWDNTLGGCFCGRDCNSPSGYSWVCTI